MTCWCLSVNLGIGYPKKFEVYFSGILILSEGRRSDLGPKVSIIIPAYNAETTLKRCLDSVFAQDFDGYEVILINDGSTDGTLNIAREFEKKHNFVLVDQENCGSARARFNGFMSSHGDFLVFVDADDYIAPDMISKMYQGAIGNGADVAVSGIKRSNGKINLYWRYQSDSETGIQATEKIMKGTLNRSLCNKLFARGLFLEEDFQRTIGIKYGEDLFLLAPTVARARKVVYLEEVLYFYFWNPTSTTNRPTVNALTDFLKVHSFLLEFYGSPRFSEWNHLARCYFAQDLIHILRVLNRVEKGQAARDLRSNIHSLLNDIPICEILRAKRARVFFDILLLKAGLFEVLYSAWESDPVRPFRGLWQRYSHK